MSAFRVYLDDMEQGSKKTRLEIIFDWGRANFPQLQEVIKWNQPIYTDHGTFIIGFSATPDHLAVAPEAQAMSRFKSDIEEAGYSQTKEHFRIKWTDALHFDLLGKIIAFNIEDKKEVQSFWRV